MQNVFVFQILLWIVCGYSSRVRYILIWVYSCWHFSVSTKIIIWHSILFEVYGHMEPVEKVVLLWYGYWKMSLGECVRFCSFCMTSFEGFIHKRKTTVGFCDYCIVPALLCIHTFEVLHPFRIIHTIV
jgi:hypothetical protein